jgi:hypothetical protein
MKREGKTLMILFHKKGKPCTNSLRLCPLALLRENFRQNHLIIG